MSKSDKKSFRYNIDIYHLFQPAPPIPVFGIPPVLDSAWEVMKVYLKANAHIQPNDCKSMEGKSMYVRKFSLNRRNRWKVGEVVSIKIGDNKADEIRIQFRIIGQESKDLFILCGLGERAMVRYTYNALTGLKLMSRSMNSWRSTK